MKENRLIPDFMGATFHDSINDFDEPYVVVSYAKVTKPPGQHDSTFSLSMVEKKYITSWDWLMTVVEKIEGMQYPQTDAEYIEFKFWRTQPELWASVIGYESFGDRKYVLKTYASGSSKNKFEAVYNSVINFILYYNKQS